jgi:mono/diheme cytochrome c family protein
MHKTGLALCCALVAALFVAVPSAQAQANDAMMKRGKMLWQNRGCGSCHHVGRRMIAPDLAGLEVRRSKEWIARFLKETDVMLQSDSTAMALMAEYNGARMPKQSLSDQDIDALLNYIRNEENRVAKK